MTLLIQTFTGKLGDLRILVASKIHADKALVYVRTSTIATPGEIEDPELQVPDNFEQRERSKTRRSSKKKELNTPPVEIYHPVFPTYRRKTGQLSKFPVQLKGSV